MRYARIRAGLTGAEINSDIKRIYADAATLERITGIKYHVDHIIPLSKGGKHEVGNRSDALKLEYRVKQLSKPDKERLVSKQLHIEKLPT